MTVLTKIDFQHRRISRISDFTELMEMLFPGNRNQQHAAACIFFELKWADAILPSLVCIESRYNVSRRVLQRTRAKMGRLGLIEYVSYLNSRYGGQHGWKLSSRFETSLKKLAHKTAFFRDSEKATEKKEALLLGFSNSRRITKIPEEICGQKGAN